MRQSIYMGFMKNTVLLCLVFVVSACMPTMRTAVDGEEEISELIDSSPTESPTATPDPSPIDSPTPTPTPTFSTMITSETFIRAGANTTPTPITNSMTNLGLGGLGAYPYIASHRIGWIYASLAGGTGGYSLDSGVARALIDPGIPSCKYVIDFTSTLNNDRLAIIYGHKGTQPSDSSIVSVAFGNDAAPLVALNGLVNIPVSSGSINTLITGRSKITVIRSASLKVFHDDTELFSMTAPVNDGTSVGFQIWTGGITVHSFEVYGCD
jgi:hypothetical protein